MPPVATVGGLLLIVSSTGPPALCYPVIDCVRFSSDLNTRVVDSLAILPTLYQGDMAVRLALGETHLVKENREYFEREGVDLNVLESSKAKGGGKGAEERSSTVILVKNLPYSTEAAELAKRFGAFGDVSERPKCPSALAFSFVFEHCAR